MKKVWVFACAISVGICILLLLGLTVFAPALTEWYGEFRSLKEESTLAILIAFYACLIPTGAALVSLMLLLKNIYSQKLFDHGNTRLMNLVALCCLLVALATGIGGVWYLPLVLVTAAMLFLFLVVRVVSGCFSAAIALREENDLTI